MGEGHHLYSRCYRRMRPGEPLKEKETKLITLYGSDWVTIIIAINHVMLVKA